MKKIAVIGSLNLDLIANTPHIPAVGETVLAKYGGKFRGGKGANQATAIAKLGGDVVMLGCVGADANGEYLLTGLMDSGVDVKNVKKIHNEPTGQAWITVDKQGDNAIVVLPGANFSVDKSYIEAMQPIIRDVDIVLLQMEIPLETVCFTAKMAKEMGKLVVLDPAPATENFPDALFADVDYIKPNETELKVLTNGCEDYEKAVVQLHNRGVGNVIVSLGSRGVYCHTKYGNTFEMPARKADVVDTTAAGDSFLAAFVLELSKGQEFAKAIDFAQLVASITVTRLGAQSSIPTAAEVEAFAKI